jgi:hypothetical protein
MIIGRLLHQKIVEGIRISLLHLVEWKYMNDKTWGYRLKAAILCELISQTDGSSVLAGMEINE